MKLLDLGDTFALVFDNRMTEQEYAVTYLWRVIKAFEMLDQFFRLLAEAGVLLLAGILAVGAGRDDVRSK